jgi:ubiquinone/menaquinone biosynthesis C-methylase UbiE
MDVGCGNSPFLLDAAADENLLRALANRPSDDGGPPLDSTPPPMFIGIDFSAVAIEQLRRRATEGHMTSTVDFLACDARRIPTGTLPDGCVAVIVDKGTLDAMDCAESEDDDTVRCLASVHRLLPLGGFLVSITCRSTERRRETIERCNMLLTSEGEQTVYATQDTASLENDTLSPTHIFVAAKKHV